MLMESHIVHWHILCRYHLVLNWPTCTTRRVTLPCMCMLLMKMTLVGIIWNYGKCVHFLDSLSSLSKRVGTNNRTVYGVSRNLFFKPLNLQEFILLDKSLNH